MNRPRHKQLMKIRTDLDLDRYEMAEKLDVSYSHYCGLENENRTIHEHIFEKAMEIQPNTWHEHLTSQKRVKVLKTWFNRKDELLVEYINENNDRKAVKADIFTKQFKPI